MHAVALVHSKIHQDRRAVIERGSINFHFQSMEMLQHRVWAGAWWTGVKHQVCISAICFGFERDVVG